MSEDKFPKIGVGIQKVRLKNIEFGSFFKANNDKCLKIEFEQNGDPINKTHREFITHLSQNFVSSSYKRVPSKFSYKVYIDKKMETIEVGQTPTFEQHQANMEYQYRRRFISILTAFGHGKDVTSKLPYQYVPMCDFLVKNLQRNIGNQVEVLLEYNYSGYVTLYKYNPFIRSLSDENTKFTDKYAKVKPEPKQKEETNPNQTTLEVNEIPF